MLPRIAIQRPERVIGKDTVSNMQSGVFWGYVGLIEGMVDTHQGGVGTTLTVVGTGGVASLFEGATEPCIDRFDPDLTIRGLLEIWRRNTHLRDLHEKSTERRTRLPAAGRLGRDRDEPQSATAMALRRPQVDRGRCGRDLRRPPRPASTSSCLTPAFLEGETTSAASS
jgi:hypothetical protein